MLSNKELNEFFEWYYPKTYFAKVDNSEIKLPKEIEKSTFKDTFMFAYKYYLNNRLTVNSLLTLEKIINRNEDGFVDHGLRKKDLDSPIRPVAKIKDIKPRLASLLKAYQGFTISDDDARNSYFMDTFLSIYPFSDGNARIATIIVMVDYLKNNKKPPIFDSRKTFTRMIVAKDTLAFQNYFEHQVELANKE